MTWNRNGREIPLAAAILLGAAAAHADTVAGATAALSDTKPSFDASGTLTTTDATNNGMSGPTYAVNNAAGAHNWDFDVEHISSWNAAGAVDARLCVGGVHHIGPHEEDDPDNALAEVCSKAVPVAFGVDGSIKVSKYNREDHETNDRGNHFDHYGVKGVFTALAGAGNQLTGAYEVHGRHEKTSSQPKEFKGYCLASTSSQGTFCSYDAGLQVLRFFIGAIDVLDDQGGGTRTVAPPYIGDPATTGHLFVSDLRFLGPWGDGYRFDAGHVSFMDHRGNFDAQGSFPGALIRGNNPGPASPSYALFDALDVKDIVFGPSSLFLEDFTNGNMLWPADSTRSMEGIVLGLVPDQDLVQATAGFTMSAGVPATVLIALLGDAGVVAVDEPVAPARPQALDARPNPARAGATVRFSLPVATPFVLRVFDAAGRLVRSTSSEQGMGAAGSWHWDGTDAHGRAVAPGTYYYELQAGGRSFARKLVMLR